jgi:hypothetical protein
MSVRKFAFLALSLLGLSAVVRSDVDAPVATISAGNLWRDPRGRAENLFYGAGSKAGQPRGPFTFVKEDEKGSSPKYVVRDSDGVKWKVKLGRESQAETAAARLVWAAGYFTRENYLLPDMHVEGLPAHLKRHKLIEPGGTMRNASLRRVPGDAEKAGEWKWREDPFRDTREWNGLRAMMALLNNWDLKDDNNAIYQRDGERIYMVSDLGASFGAPGRSFPASRSKNNFAVYRQSRFVCSTHPDTVDFCAPRRAALEHLVDPLEYHRRLTLRWIGRGIPRADARWLGAILARLSPNQIRDAFRAGGYSPAEVAGFAEVVEQRIAELNSL